MPLLVSRQLKGNVQGPPSQISAAVANVVLVLIPNIPNNSSWFIHNLNILHLFLLQWLSPPSGGEDNCTDSVDNDWLAGVLWTLCSDNSHIMSELSNLINETTNDFMNLRAFFFQNML